MDTIPQFDELHVVSDLHLGGLDGFQIFDQASPFKRLVNYLQEHQPARRVGLVVNGDLVDFLAEPGATYFDPVGACAKLDRITRDSAFAPVWQALARFVRSQNCALAVTLGNHDLELAMPWVREQLLHVLSGGDPAARGRVTLAFDGTGFRCRVGAANVLCLHGNEVDDWNVTDYEALRRAGRDLSRGLARPDWVPNAGARLVIDVMNGIKKRYPFVDLLKPETEAVIPTLLALDPRLAVKVGAAIPSIARRAWDAARLKTGFLNLTGGVADVGDDGAPTADKALERMLGRTFGDDGRAAVRSYDPDELLAETEKRLAAGVEPLQLLGPAGNPRFLGIIGAVRNLITRKGPAEVLREALAALGTDSSFDVKSVDHTYLALDGWVGPGIDFLIVGHTHLERALPLSRPGGYYYNSGTWARLMRLSADLLGDPAGFEAFYEAAGYTGGGATLDQLGVVLRRPAVVSLRDDRGRVHGELRHVDPAADPPYIPVDRTQYTWS